LPGASNNDFLGDFGARCIQEMMKNQELQLPKHHSSTMLTIDLIGRKKSKNDVYWTACHKCLPGDNKLFLNS